MKTDFSINVNVSYFNSIKVRLELLILISLDRILRFQFHKGAIRTHFNDASVGATTISIP